MNNYLQYLFSLEAKGIKLGLERTESILKACGNPHQNIRSIQVVGTNGKGSTSAIIANILKAAGHRVGLYTSPHLNKINERIRIDGYSIKDDDIIDFINNYKRDINQLKISFFEVMTALAIWYFDKKNVDIAILETGLGGRLDSVSICNPELLVFTHISLDHQHILGNTIEKIALEKAGAIKKNAKCVSCEQQPRVENILTQKVNNMKGHIKYVKTVNNNIKLNGNHQFMNASLAIKAVKSLVNFNITDNNIQSGLSTIKWPGRLQEIYQSPSIYFDVAHNEISFLSLCQFTKNLKNKGKKILIIAIQQHKSLGSSIKYILDIFDKIIITQSNIRNFLSAEKLYILLNSSKVSIILDIHKAINYAKKQPKEDCIIIAGSHYLGPAINKEFKISFENI